MARKSQRLAVDTAQIPTAPAPLPPTVDSDKEERGAFTSPDVVDALAHATAPDDDAEIGGAPAATGWFREQPEAPKTYNVLRTKMVAIGGSLVSLAKGSIVSETTHDLASLVMQGVELE